MSIHLQYISPNTPLTTGQTYTGYMRNLHVACGKATSVSIGGNIWTRTFGQVFRSRRPFFISDTYRLNDTIFGGLVFTEKSDLILRINT